jgi:hypothetical protein
MQGYFISKPLKECELAQFLDDFNENAGNDLGPAISYTLRAAEA